MNRKVMALAVATAFTAPVAFAQSSVTVGGTINIMWDTVRAGGGTAAAGAGDLKSHDRVRDGAGSNIRFTVIEDLGGGNSAFVQVESAVISNSDQRANALQGNAGATTAVWGNRNSGIGIRSKAAGRFLIGVWDVHYDEMTRVDPGWLIVNSGASSLGLMNTFGGAASQISQIGARYSNVIRWDSPVWGGFSMTVSYARPTDAAPVNAAGTIPDSKKNRMWSFAPRYEAGGLTVQYTYLQDKDINSNQTVSMGGVNTLAATVSAAWKVKSNRLGARYKFANGLGIGAIWDSSKQSNQVLAAQAGAAVDIKRTVWSFPVTYETGNHHMFITHSRARDWRGSVGNVNVSAVAGAGGTLGSDTGAKMWNLGYAYKLSQRTNVHVSYNTIKNERSVAYDFFAQSSGLTAANVGADPKQFAVGIRHTF